MKLYCFQCRAQWTGYRIACVTMGGTDLYMQSKFRSDGDVRLLRLGEDLPPWRSANTQSLGALFVGFVDYFANRFGFSRSCASVRLGAPISSMEVVGASGTARSQWKYVCVEGTSTSCSRGWRHP